MKVCEISTVLTRLKMVWRISQRKQVNEKSGSVEFTNKRFKSVKFKPKVNSEIGFLINNY